MRRFLLYISYILLVCVSLNAADTTYIAPCDDVKISIFGDMISLSRDEGVLRRYEQNKLVDIYQGDEKSSQPILQEPLGPVLDGADLIYLLDIASNKVYAWDRFLNIHSITDLNDDLISPSSFTITSEHDWLIYDDFFGQILQVRPGESFYSEWGDKPISGEVELDVINDRVIIYLIDQSAIRVADVNGTTLGEYPLPESMEVKRVFPMENGSFVLSASDGVYSWKPASASLRYLSDMKNTVYCHLSNSNYILISQEGVVVSIP